MDNTGDYYDRGDTKKIKFFQLFTCYNVYWRRIMLGIITLMILIIATFQIQTIPKPKPLLIVKRNEIE